MDDSERVQRLKRAFGCEDLEDVEDIDRAFADRIAALLDHPKIDENCMVDAYYYDFSPVPLSIRNSLKVWIDCYLIFGITTDGEIVSKWVDRWDLDSDDPIIDGEVIKEEREGKSVFLSPETKKYFDEKLLSTSMTDFVSYLFSEATIDKTWSQEDLDKFNNRDKP